jgi:YHS domain-containing protein
MAKDPVCGMDVKSGNAIAKSEYGGQTFLFCSVGCKQKFDQAPDKFAKEAAHTAHK